MEFLTSSSFHHSIMRMAVRPIPLLCGNFRSSDFLRANRIPGIRKFSSIKGRPKLSFLTLDQTIHIFDFTLQFSSPDPLVLDFS